MSAISWRRRNRDHRVEEPRRRRSRAALDAVLVLAVLAVVALLPSNAQRASALVASNTAAPTGQGLTITPGDLKFILKQIKIAERHAATLSSAHPCDTLVGPGKDQIPDALTSYGLRTVDGSCNNLIPGREKFATADQPFPRLTPSKFRDAETRPAGLFGPNGPPAGTSPTSYTQKKGSVYDSQPRTISNLIVDQTSTNPAAIAAAEFPVRSQNNPGLFPCTTEPDPTATPPVAGVPTDCVPAHKTLFIPNVTTDVGLSPPYNSLFTFFGQFFDHGVDQTVKSGGTVFVPLKPDDPLITLGPDGKAGTGDEVPEGQRFMVLTRAQNQPGPDKILGDRPPTDPGPPVTCTSLNVPAGCDESADDIQDANNTDSPWVDQSQTYTSHPSHQALLREYQMQPGPDGILVDDPATAVNEAADNVPADTGKLLGGTPGTNGASGMATWATVKEQARTKLGLKLVDVDVQNVPMLATDPYGNFIPGPHGLPQYVTTDAPPNDLVEGSLTAPVAVPAHVKHFDTPFLTDIAHNADPGTVGPCTTRPVNTPNGPTPGDPAGCLDPDDDTTASADFAHQPVGTYDDEMLNAHFCAGDGRVNENIALTTIHQVFHSEHDRLVDYIKGVLEADGSAAGIAALADWKGGKAGPDGILVNDPATAVDESADNAPNAWNYGQRLFQAARFVTEMEYQHLVFEEFARKVQPAIRPFHLYHSDINAAIPAEFAHAVYRFGHSMLDDQVARTNVDAAGAKSDNSVPLLTAFLNPPEFYNGGPNFGTLTPEQAAGSIVMGSSDQVGNELDEFVTETLRNNLLGLPLDLPTLNMARARDAGVPPLNVLRKQIFAATSDGQMTPYTSWSDFGQHLKHPESLINFVAAYGTHPSITSETTLAGKRAAARAIVDPLATDSQPADASDFMFSTGEYADTPGGKSTSGLDDVDLWVGGLAEVTNLNGGLLGSTFNYVFQSTLENLQDGDRLYYLARTPGLNLRTQLEGNSFSELIERNTVGTSTLKADAFATADCKFELKNINGPYTGPATRPTGEAAQLGAGSVNDDPSTTDCDENLLLTQKPDGTIQYRLINRVDPSGINGQSVYNGKSDATATDAANVDRIFGGVDNDTFWGGLGNDIIEGNNGDDVALGGDGNDRITDLGGADVLKGGPGNDSLDAGPGDDIILGGDGSDMTNGGANDNETFGGPGNDFINAGQGADAVFGDGGDDWIQGGSGQDLLQGDHGAPFFDDPGETKPGNDVFVGQVGENDYDTEGGDDLMAQNAAIDRNAGSGGFDWAFHQYDTVGADDDMAINNNLLGLPLPIVVNRDRWQETEADSGSPFDDIIRGDDAVPSAVGGAGFTGCDVLDQAGVDRINGLAAILPPLAGDIRTDVTPNSATGACPLGDSSPGATAAANRFWGAGNILLGGAGSDTITGRGGDDIIDGDRALTVRISVRDHNNRALEVGSTDLMEHPYDSTGKTLQAAVADGTVDAGDLSIIREVADQPSANTSTDTAVFSGPRSNYSVVVDATKVTVTQTGANVVGQKVSDGIDTLRNIEALKFSDVTLTLQAPPAPTGVTATATTAPTATGSATVTWTRAAPVAPAATSQEIAVIAGGTVVRTITGIGPAVSTRTINNLANGTSYTFKVRAVNAIGAGPFSAPSNAVTPVGLPLAPTGATATRGNTLAHLSWTNASDGGSPITRYEVQVRNGTVVARTDTIAVPAGGTLTSTDITGLTNGTAYNFRVRAVNAIGTGALSGASNNVTPATVPGAPVSVLATAGTAGAPLTASVSWQPPTAATGGTGGANIVNYRVRALHMDADGTTVLDVTSVLVGANARSRNFNPLPAGNYRFEVIAVNAVGDGAASGRSNAVAAT